MFVLFGLNHSGQVCCVTFFWGCLVAYRPITAESGLVSKSHKTHKQFDYWTVLVICHPVRLEILTEGRVKPVPLTRCSWV